MDNSIKTKGIIVGVCYKDEETFNYEMKELNALCEACNIEVIDELIQYLDAPLQTSYLGSGKLIELKTLVDVTAADVVILNDEISPATLSNIQGTIEAEILDRTMLILEIFKSRAKTKEATLQVELANLSYMLPRLIGARTNLSRTGGGGAGGGGARRGSGETKLELDRRYIENRITHLKQELNKVVLNRQITRKSREKNNLKTVAVVGYTNAGKSTTINTLIDYLNQDESKKVFTKDMLFATLDTATRLIRLNDNHEFLLTDTVGFVSKLPHMLVESFKSTLEEITEASLIIQIVDASSPFMEKQVTTTNEVIKELGAQSIPMIYVLNKQDLVKNAQLITNNYEPSIRFSAITKQGIDELIEVIKSKLFADEITCDILIPYTKGDIYNYLKENSHILSTSYTNDGILLTATISKILYNKYKEYIKES